MSLKVTFEVVPYGEEDACYSIGTLEIHNAGGALGFCTYYGTFTTDRGDITKFENVQHSRQDGFLVLVQKVLEHIEDTSSNS